MSDHPGDRGLPALRLLGPSGSGKTTLGERLVHALTERGYRVATVKSAHRHPGPPDREGADTSRYRAAGAAAGAGVFLDGTIVTTPAADLDTLLEMLRPVADLALVEGFRDATLPTLAFVDEAGRRDAYLGPTVALIARSLPAAAAEGAPAYLRDDIAGIAAEVARWLDEDARGRA
ncbi:MAG: molybdopterin-guanine dinucleotide biosynthesis protein B [Dehalococcoidia bacterium]